MMVVWKVEGNQVYKEYWIDVVEDGKTIDSKLYRTDVFEISEEMYGSGRGVLDEEGVIVGVVDPEGKFWTCEEWMRGRRNV